MAQHQSTKTPPSQDSSSPRGAQNPKTGRLLRCEIHFRRRLVKSKGKESPKPKYHRSFKPGEKPGSCICDYEEFPILLGERLGYKERRNSSNRELEFIETPTPIKIDHHFPKILLLPQEIRDQIYEEILISPTPIEFAPEPWIFKGTAPPGEAGREHFEEYWQDVWDHHTQNIRNFQRSARFLRVSKQVHHETAGILYGKNDFRFSNSSGWVALNVFLFRIGLENCNLLKNVTVRHPDLTVLPKSLAGNDHFASSLVWLHLPRVRDGGLYYPTRWFEHRLYTDPKRVLEKAANLKRLRLVYGRRKNHEEFPVTMQEEIVEAEQVLERVLDERKFERLEVSVIFLRGEHGSTFFDRNVGVVDGVAERPFDAEAEVEQRGLDWKVLEAEYDGFGRYEPHKVSEGNFQGEGHVLGES